MPRNFDGERKMKDKVEYVGFWKRSAAGFIDVVLLSFISWGIANILFFVGFWAWKGQTPGKMLMKQRVVRIDGSPIDLKTSIIRFIGYVVCCISFGIGFITIAFDSKKQGWHDKIAGTYVISDEEIER